MLDLSVAFLTTTEEQLRDLGQFEQEFAPVIPWHGAGMYRVTPLR